MAGQLVPQSSGAGNAAFAQQGTLDWTALSRSSFTFSVEVMSRFSKAGVEMITCAMGQAMCSQFSVPPEGQKRVTDAISKLKAYSSYGQLLWFGFGVKHIIRSLCETKQGATCAALCACLRVSYSTEMSARVLSLLCDQLLPSDGLSPALAQWGALIDVCSGALSPSKFPVMVDGFCRLALADPRRRSYRYNATTVDALAHALAELSKVSSGSVSSITFEGGYDCGWIAAVAEWLLCLKVKVLTEDGSCQYWQDGSHTNGSAQVIIIFKTDTYDSDLTEIKELRVINRSFRLPCNGEVKLVNRSSDGGEVFGMGRSSWSTILEDTFGSAFKLLLSPNLIDIFAKLLLSGVNARPSLMSEAGGEMIHPWMRSFSNPAASRERAFFLAIANRLPELTPLLDALEHLEKSVGAAAGPDGNPFRNLCGCELCGRSRPRDRTPRDLTRVIPRKICRYHVGLTLLTLIWLLARIDVDETLQPASTGLFMLYEYVVTNDINFLTKPICFIKCESPGWDADLDCTYRRTFELLTGLPSHKNLHKLGAASATCHGGICIWLPALENPLYDPSKQMALRVVPGRVSFRDRLYTEIVDIGESEVSDDLNSVMSEVAAHGPSRISRLIIRDTLDASHLEAWIELRSGKTSHTFNTYLDQHGVERPQHSPSELRLRIRQLYGTLHERIDRSTCEVNLGRVQSQRLPKPDLTTWEYPCPSLAVLLESTTPPKRSYNYPEAGEWVVIETDICERVPIVRLLRGDFTLVYYLMSIEYSRSATCLSCFDGCIRCLAFSFTTRRGCQIEIHTITENECTLWSAKMTGMLPEEERVTP